MLFYPILNVCLFYTWNCSMCLSGVDSLDLHNELWSGALRKLYPDHCPFTTEEGQDSITNEKQRGLQIRQSESRIWWFSLDYAFSDCAMEGAGMQWRSNSLRGQGMVRACLLWRGIWELGMGHSLFLEAVHLLWVALECIPEKSANTKLNTSKCYKRREEGSGSE